jgi:hypothetical protein
MIINKTFCKNSKIQSLQNIPLEKYIDMNIIYFIDNLGLNLLSNVCIQANLLAQFELTI